MTITVQGTGACAFRLDAGGATMWPVSLTYIDLPNGLFPRTYSFPVMKEGTFSITTKRGFEASPAWCDSYATTTLTVLKKPDLRVGRMPIAPSARQIAKPSAPSGVGQIATPSAPAGQIVKPSAPSGAEQFKGPPLVGKTAVAKVPYVVCGARFYKFPNKAFNIPDGTAVNTDEFPAIYFVPDFLNKGGGDSKAIAFYGGTKVVDVKWQPKKEALDFGDISKPVSVQLADSMLKSQVSGTVSPLGEGKSSDWSATKINLRPEDFLLFRGEILLRGYASLDVGGRHCETTIKLRYD